MTKSTKLDTQQEESKTETVPPHQSYRPLFQCQDPSTGAWTDSSFVPLYLTKQPAAFPGLQEEAFLTLLAFRILEDRFGDMRDEWRMVANKGYVYLRRSHSLDEVAAERVRDEIQGVEYRV
jgi:hypothetical protein